MNGQIRQWKNMFHDKKYVFGDQNVQVPAHLNFGKYILEKLKKMKDEIAIENIDTNEKLSYRDITQKAVNLAVSLLKLGVKKGDVVAIGTEKRIEFFPIVLAIVFTGATYTPYDLNSGRATLKHKINIARPQYFIGSNKFLDRYKDMLENFDCVRMILTIDNAFDNVKSLKDISIKDDVNIQLFDPIPVDGQSDVVCIYYSSGTTGLSKGVQITHLNYILHCNNNGYIDDSLKTAFTLGDWHQSYGITISYKSLVLGRKIVYGDNFSYALMIRSITDYQANIMLLEPSVISILLKEDDLSKCNLNSLKTIYSVGSPLHPNTIDKLKNKFSSLQNVLQGYGMTEADLLTCESIGDKGQKPGSVGKASSGYILKISDLETRKTLGPYDRGEICIKTPALMKGYIGIDISNDLDEEGFFRTGDFGYYDEDNYLFIVGRLKEIILYNGYNIPPLELETILQLHPAVREAGVVGKPDPIFEEVPVAFVVKQPGAVVTEQELLDYVAEEVDHHMKLKGGIQFIEKIPRNSGGKILRNKLKELLN